VYLSSCEDTEAARFRSRGQVNAVLASSLSRSLQNYPVLLLLDDDDDDALDICRMNAAWWIGWLGNAEISLPFKAD